MLINNHLYQIKVSKCRNANNHQSKTLFILNPLIHHAVVSIFSALVANKCYAISSHHNIFVSKILDCVSYLYLFLCLLQYILKGVKKNNPQNDMTSLQFARKQFGKRFGSSWTDPQAQRSTEPGSTPASMKTSAWTTWPRTSAALRSIWTWWPV